MTEIMCLQGAFSSTADNNLYRTKYPEFNFKNFCTKVFIVASVVLATIIAVVGILALMASKGFISDVTSLHKLSIIGEVNSYVMLGGGLMLFVLGVIAWGCELHKENQQKKREK